MLLKKGDFILVHSHNFSAKIIQFGMNVERWLHLDFSPFWDKIYNHAALCITDKVISEALPEGITIDLLEQAYKKGDNKELIVFRPHWTPVELQKLYTAATKYKGVEYQFLNFLQFIPKILFNVWLGKTHKSSKDKLYCTEYLGAVANDISGGKYFPKYWKTSPNDVYKWCLENATLIGHIKL